MCIYFSSLIGVNKIADLNIDFRNNHEFQGSSNEKNAKINKISLLIPQQWGRLLENSAD